MEGIIISIVVITIITIIAIITIITLIISMAPPYCFQPMYDPPFFHGEEDCLYLNIFTSKVRDRVISLFIHRKMFNEHMKYKK